MHAGDDNLAWQRAAGGGASAHAHGLIPGPTLDFVNLTAGAQTSDGLHSLSDVNLIKAHALVRVLELTAAA